MKGFLAESSVLINVRAEGLEFFLLTKAFVVPATDRSVRAAENFMVIFVQREEWTVRITGL